MSRITFKKSDVVNPQFYVFAEIDTTIPEHEVIFKEAHDFTEKEKQMLNDTVMKNLVTPTIYYDICNLSYNKYGLVVLLRKKVNKN